MEAIVKQIATMQRDLSSTPRTSLEQHDLKSKIIELDDELDELKASMPSQSAPRVGAEAEVAIRENLVGALWHMSANLAYKDYFVAKPEYASEFVRLITRRESYTDKVAEIMCRVMDDTTDLYCMAKEVLFNLGKAVPSDANLELSTLTADIKGLKVALVDAKLGNDGRKQAGAMSVNHAVIQAMKRLADAYFIFWKGCVEQTKKDNIRRPQQLKLIIQFIKFQAVYLPIYNFKYNMEKDKQSVGAQDAMDQLQAEIDGLKAMEGGDLKAKILQVEGAAKQTEDAMAKLSKEKSQIEMEFNDLKNSTGGIQKSSFAATLLKLKAENKSFPALKIKLESAEDNLAIVNEEKEGLRMELATMTAQFNARSKGPDISMPGDDMPSSVPVAAPASDRGSGINANDSARIVELEQQVKQMAVALRQAKNKGASLDEADRAAFAAETAATQEVILSLESQILTLQHTTEAALMEMEQMKQNGVQGNGSTAAKGANLNLETTELLTQMAVAKTKYQSNVARLQADRQQLKQKLSDQKQNFSKQMEDIREGFLKSLQEKDDLILAARAGTQSVLRGNPQALTCFYLSDDENDPVMPKPIVTTAPNADDDAGGDKEIGQER